MLLHNKQDKKKYRLKYHLETSQSHGNYFRRFQEGNLHMEVVTDNSGDGIPANLAVAYTRRAIN
jgi:translation elongation factor EF-4